MGFWPFFLDKIQWLTETINTMLKTSHLHNMICPYWHAISMLHILLPWSLEEVSKFVLSAPSMLCWLQSESCAARLFKSAMIANIVIQSVVFSSFHETRATLRLGRVSQDKFAGDIHNFYCKRITRKWFTLKMKVKVMVVQHSQFCLWSQLSKSMKDITHFCDSFQHFQDIRMKKCSTFKI